MELWCGVITPKIRESAEFFRRVFGFATVFEEDWIVILEREGRYLGFMVPDHPSQSAPFRGAYAGAGMWLALNVDDVDAEYRRIRDLDVPIAVELRDEPWGDRHFVVLDPNGIGVDMVTHHDS